MNDKLRLDYFLSVGGKLTKGDDCCDTNSNEQNTFVGVEENGEYKGYFDFTGDAYGLYSQDEFNQLVITSFTDRKAKMIHELTEDIPIIIKRGRIDTWKPDYEALLKMQAKHDKHNESIIKACGESLTKACDKAKMDIGEFKETPIYTQEMKDNGELPSVGMKFSTEFYGNHIAEAVSKTQVCFIGNNGNFDALDIKACLPYKTPEEIELEEAKKKQVDIATNEIMTLTNLLYKDANFLATKLQSKGFLNEIILPLKK